jgi:predicted RNA-binding protein Jag
MKRVDNIEDNIQKIVILKENKIEKTEESKIVKTVEKIIELKLEKLNISDEDGHIAMQYRDHRTVLYIFKKYYKNKVNSQYAYPVRIISKRSYDYYHDGCWNSDLYGKELINILCTNIQNLLIKLNILDNKKITMDSFIVNQMFIKKLSDDKARREYLKHIIEEVRVNNS